MTQMIKTDQQCMKWLRMKNNETKNSVAEIFKLCESENIPEIVHQELVYLYRRVQCNIEWLVSWPTG